MRSERFTRELPSGFVETGVRHHAENEKEQDVLRRVGLGVFPTDDPMVFEQFYLGPFPRAPRTEDA